MCVCVRCVTLHAGGAELLPGEEDGMVVVLSVPGVRLLLQEGPATHVLQTLGRVPQLDQTHGLEGGTGEGGGDRGRGTFQSRRYPLLFVYCPQSPVGGSGTMICIGDHQLYIVEGIADLETTQAQTHTLINVRDHIFLMNFN